MGREGVVRGGNVFHLQTFQLGGGAKESDGGQDDKDGAAYLSLHKVIVECSALQQL